MTERKIALYDIDKTSYGGFLVQDLCEYQFQNGILPEKNFARINRDINLYRERVLGYEEMAENVLGYWAEGLKGKKVNIVVNNTREFFRTKGKKFLPFAQESIDLLRPTHDTFFVTAEPQFVAEEVANIHRATGYFSTIFEVKDGVFTGNLSSSLATREDKGNVLKQLLLTHSKEQSLAFGDSDNDIEMLEGVEYPICVNPNDELRKIRDERGWKTITPDEIVIFIKEVIKPTTNS